MFWLKWSGQIWSPTCLLQLAATETITQELRAPTTTIQNLWALLRERGVYSTPRNLLPDSNRQTHLLFIPLFPETCSFTEGFQRWTWMSSMVEGTQDYVWILGAGMRGRNYFCTQEFLKLIKGGVCQRKKGHHRDRRRVTPTHPHAHTYVYARAHIHTHNPTCTHICIHKKSGDNPFGKTAQVE